MSLHMTVSIMLSLGATTFAGWAWGYSAKLAQPRRSDIRAICAAIVIFAPVMVLASGFNGL